MATWRAMAGAALAAAATLIGSLGAAPAAHAQAGVDVTCQLALTRLEPTTTNALLLDTNAAYWVVSYQAAPGTRIRITGDFPHSRYMSWNLYDAQAAPIDSLADYEISPDAGSSNPFLPGADRRATERRYTATVDFGPRPATPAPNTLYTQQPGQQPSYIGTLWYRVYMPDRGLGLTGGVPLPDVTVETPAGLPISTQPCRDVQPPTFQAVNDAIAANDGGPLPILGAYPGQTPPKWTLFVNLALALKEILLDNPSAAQSLPYANQVPVSQGAGFFSSRDNSYVYAPTSRGYGQLIVIHGRAPTFANTRPSAQTMPSGQQLRYFSFCQYDPLSQRVIACVPDDQVAVDRDGNYTVVVSTASERPSNARAACGVTWLPWGPTAQGLLIYRNMLADPAFAGAVQRIGQPGNEHVMGAYYPTARYLANRQEFEARGCSVPAPGRRAATHHKGRRRKHATPGRPRVIGGRRQP